MLLLFAPRFLGYFSVKMFLCYELSKTKLTWRAIHHELTKPVPVRQYLVDMNKFSSTRFSCLARWTLFKRVLRNTNHVLHDLLPPLNNQSQSREAPTQSSNLYHGKCTSTVKLHYPSAVGWRILITDLCMSTAMYCINLWQINRLVTGSHISLCYSVHSRWLGHVNLAIKRLLL